MPERDRTVDLTNCDREPIHLPGAVQPFGFLLAVDAADWSIVALSRNVETFAGRAAGDLIGRPLADVLSRDALHIVRDQLRTAASPQSPARVFAVPALVGGGQFGGARFDMAIHRTPQAIFVECEPSSDECGANSGAFVRAMIGRLHETQDLDDYLRIAAREIRVLTGFDRVMIYRFDPDGSGEVIAEAVDAARESYLGLHYPASDIPRQARLLYERNWLRIIPDVGAPPSPLLPGHDAAGRPFDLSMSVLRSVSPIHIEYLRNMGVAASMSVSILREGRLWGLFACHHYGPLRLAFERRTAAELFGQMFSLLLDKREREREAAYEARARSLHNRLITAMATEGTRFDGIVGHLGDFSNLLACDGVGVAADGEIALRGATPTEAEFAGLVERLSATAGDGEIVASHEIGTLHPAGRGFAERAAGMLAVPLSRPARDFLVFFRRELARTVRWAGDPAKPVVAGPLGDRLTPRRSFELWQETVRGQSAPWQPVDVRIAESLRVSLLEVILRLAHASDQERRRAHERQDLLIAELNHRVRNILGLIRAIVAQSRDVALSTEAFVEVLGGRIQALARAHDQITADNWGPASLRGLIAAEAAAYLGGKASRVRLAGPEMLLEPQGFTTVALVIHELVTNSAKYGALSDSRGSVEIETALDGERNLLLTWRERGGPLVEEPTRRGFGSTIIERSIPFDLKGEAQVDYQPSGLRAAFRIPASNVRPAPGVPLAPPSPAPGPPPARTLPEDVLIVEDNMIIALDCESSLGRAGVATLRIAPSVAQALREIDRRPPVFALLDVNLGSETSFPIAERLAALGVPFAFTSGYGEDIAYPPAFGTVPRVAKPYGLPTLLDAIHKAWPREA